LAVPIVGTDFVCRPEASGEWRTREGYSQMALIFLTCNLILAFLNSPEDVDRLVKKVGENHTFLHTKAIENS
jgi:hypothetical protein